MSTALEKVEASLQADIVVTAGQYAGDVRSFRNATIGEAELASIADRGTVIAQALKKLDAERRDILKPFEEGIERINAKFALVTAPLKSAKEAYGELYVDGRNELKRKADELAAEQARLAAAVAEPEDEDAPTPPPATVQVQAPKNTTKGGIGQATGRRDLMVKISDVKLVAEHYPALLKLDEKAAKDLVRGLLVAKQTIHGIEHWYVDSTSFGARR